MVGIIYVYVVKYKINFKLKIFTMKAEINTCND